MYVVLVLHIFFPNRPTEEVPTPSQVWKHLVRAYRYIIPYEKRKNNIMDTTKILL